jgi:hypothetical protein
MGINWSVKKRRRCASNASVGRISEEMELHMKGTVISGTAIAAAAVALALAGAAPAVAKHKTQQQKATAGKMACSAKMGCSGRK